MKLVRWNKVPAWSSWPTMFDDDAWPFAADWPELSSNKGGLDIYETENAVVVEAAVPGIPEENVNVTIEGNVVSISAEHVEAEEDKQKKKFYKNSRQTTFSYSTSLPRMVDATRASAEVKDGLLKVIVPKTEAEKPRKIEIKTSKG